MFSDIAEANPLRYRGYYYDSETGFYYVTSRYYDPEICRFINADTFATTDAEGLLSTNMFAYCENNPVMRSDPSGEFYHVLVAAAIGVMEQLATDIIYAMVSGQPLEKCFSSPGAYVAAAVSGMMTLIPFGGAATACLDVALSSCVQDVVDRYIFPSPSNETDLENDSRESVLTKSISKCCEYQSSKVADKLSKSVANMTKNFPKGAKNISRNATNKVCTKIKFLGKNIGKAVGVIFKIIK